MTSPVAYWVLLILTGTQGATREMGMGRYRIRVSSDYKLCINRVLVSSQCLLPSMQYLVALASGVLRINLKDSPSFTVVTYELVSKQKSLGNKFNIKKFLCLHQTPSGRVGLRP